MASHICFFSLWNISWGPWSSSFFVDHFILSWPAFCRFLLSFFYLLSLLCQILSFSFSIYSFIWMKCSLYWVGQKVHMFFSIKKRHIFSFSPITSLIWIFWVCWLSPAWYNVDCSQLMSQFDCQQLLYLTVKHHPVRNLQHQTSQTTFDTFDQSPYTSQIFFCISVVFLPFLK